MATGGWFGQFVPGLWVVWLICGWLGWSVGGLAGLLMVCGWF